MNPRIGITAVLASCAIALALAGCSKNSSTTPQPSPTPVPSAGPDTVFVDTVSSGSGSVRVYKGGSTDNGIVNPVATLSTSEGSQPDVVYSPLYDVLWVPAAYPQQSFTGPLPTPIRVWTSASTRTSSDSPMLVPYTDGAGAAVYDSVHDLLYVANIDGPTIDIYASAHLMTPSSTPAARITLTITDGSILNPRPIEMALDDRAAGGRLFVSDEGAVVAVFNGFAAIAANAAASRTNTTVPANQEISGLFQPDGMAYSAGNDILYVGEHNFRQIDVVHSASTFNGPVGHGQVINNFASGAPTGLAYDGTRDLLFAYEPGVGIDVIPNPGVASGNVNAIANKRTFFDSLVALSGFGIAVDTTH